MHHRAVIKLGTHDHLPYNIQCACGTGGDFGSKDEAMNWMTVNHFRFLQGVNTAEFVDEIPKAMAAAAPMPDEPEETPAEPPPAESPAEEEPEEEGHEVEEKPKPRPKKARSA